LSSFKTVSATESKSNFVNPLLIFKKCLILSVIMSENLGNAQKAKEYQKNNQAKIYAGLGVLQDKYNKKVQNATFAVESDFETQEDFNNFVESMVQSELLSDTLTPIVDNIFFIKAGTGSGKTHAVLKAFKDCVLSTEDGRAVMATPTRAMAMDIQTTGNIKVGEKQDFVGLWIGGEDGKDIDSGDRVIAVTGGKLWDFLIRDPTLGIFDNPLLDAIHQDESRIANRGLEQVSTLIIDEADAMDARAIPAIKWLSTVRPDMKIIFVSATLNIEEFNSIYQPNPDAAFVAPDQERPRPITVDYIDPSLSRKLGLSDRPKANIFTYAPLLVLDTWILGRDSKEVQKSLSNGIDVPNKYSLLESGESVIIFMPTITSVEKLGQEAANAYRGKAEVRCLHGRLSSEEIDARLNDDLTPGTIGIFVCTDVVGRGVNFPDKFNINRTIDSGLRNRPQFDPITGREVLKVGAGTQADILQGLGRAGRNTNDERPVVGFVLQEQENLYPGLT
jgi:superfamily II DNA/RNA helicase